MFWQRCSWTLVLVSLTHLPGFAQPDPSPPSSAEGAEEAAAEESQQNEVDFLAFLAQSQQNLEVGAEERLLALIKAIPPRWSMLPEPKIAYSGHGPNLILADASDAAVRSAISKFLLFSAMPLEMRPAVKHLLAQSEAAIWVPALLIQEAEMANLAKAAVLLEAWLSWAESAGRQDVLLFAAGISLDVLSLSRGARPLEATAVTWSQLPIATRAGGGAATFYVCLADVLNVVGRLDEALEAYRRARNHLAGLDDQMGQGRAWAGEASIYVRLGRNLEAFTAYRKARSFFEHIDQPLGQANTWAGEAEIHSRIGKTKNALESYRRARYLYERIDNTLGQANAWHGEAHIHLALGRNAEALNSYRIARNFYIQIGAKIGQGNTWIGEADALYIMGENLKSLDAYREARSLYVNTGEQLGQGNTWRGEANILFQLEHYQEALVAHKKARSYFEHMDDWLGLGNTWIGEARIQMRIRAFDSAEIAAREAIAIRGKKRTGFFDELTRIHHDNSTVRAYDILVPALAELGSAPEFVVAAEEAKSRVLLDLIAGGFPVRAQETDPFDVARKRRELQTRLADLQNGNEAEPGSSGHEQAVFDRELEQLAFEILVENRSALLNASPLTLQQLSSIVAEAGPVLGFYVAVEETFGYLLLPKKPPVLFRAPHSRGHWLEKAPEVVDHLANENYKNAAERDVRELWDQLFLPLAASLPESGTLVVVPHGPLHQLPFETLTDPQGRRLFERFELSVVPSLATLAELRKRHRPASQQDRLLALAGGGLSLPLKETTAVARLFDPKGAADLVASLPTYSTYEERVPGARHLLVASHGMHDEGNLRQTYLAIEPSTNHDHRLSAAEIATIPIEAELVTLAACDTAVGKAGLSDERLDLSRAFLVAGAAAVLATRWRLPDDPRTTQFLVDFYSAYRGVDGQKGKRKAEALNIARRLAIERGDPSAFWAAWVLIGDPR